MCHKLGLVAAALHNFHCFFMGVMAFLNRLRPLRANATLLTDGPKLGLESQSGKSWHSLSESGVCNICVERRALIVDKRS